MRRRTLIAVTAATAALAACEVQTAHPPLTLALDAQICPDYCVSTVFAEVTLEGRGLPLGPPQTVSCGDPIVFHDLRAGQRVTAHLLMTGVDGTLRLQGTSAPVTIAGEETTTITVPLDPLAPPLLDAVSPDPLVTAGAPAALTLTGSFGPAPEGRTAITLGAHDLALTDWESDRIITELSGAVVGRDVRVTHCGITSAPLPLRVLPTSALALTPVAAPPGCAGRTWTALHRADASTLYASAACDDPGESYVQRLTTDAEGCSVVLAEAWPVAGRPLAVYSGPPGLLIATDLGALLLDPDDGQTSPLPTAVAGPVQAIAATGAQTYAIVHGEDNTTVALRGAEGALSAIAGLTAGLEFRGPLVAHPDGVYALAVAPGRVGKLVTLRDAGPPTELALSPCDDPRDLAQAGDWLLVACGDADTSLAAVHPASVTLTHLSLDEPLHHIAADAAGDVAFGSTAGGIAVVQRGDSDVVPLLTRQGPLGNAPLIRAGTESRLVTLDADGQLVVIAPYADGACPGGAPP